MSRMNGAGSGVSESLQGALTEARHAFNRGNGPACWANDNNLEQLDRVLRYTYPLLETSALRYRVVNAAEATRHFDVAASRRTTDSNAVQKAWSDARNDYGIHFRLLDENRHWVDYRISPLTRNDQTVFSVHKIFKGAEPSETPVPRAGTVSYFDKERHVMVADDVVRHMAPLVQQHMRWNATPRVGGGEIAAAVIATALAAAAIPLVVQGVQQAGQNIRERVVDAMNVLPSPTGPRY